MFVFFFFVFFLFYFFFIFLFCFFFWFSFVFLFCFVLFFCGGRGGEGNLNHDFYGLFNNVLFKGDSLYVCLHRFVQPFACEYL